ncbi:MAG TPA: signal peptide peptidase SppA [Lacunisphaera sp.]|nr:signal peptide peptidase SppA [Lacunisphaera sp.]
MPFIDWDYRLSNSRPSNRFSLAVAAALPTVARMKNFFTSFFAALMALIVFALGGMVLCFLVLAAFAALGQKKTVTVQRGSYLVLDLAAAIRDAPSQTEGLDQIMEAFGDRGLRTLQLRQVTRSLEAAAHDDDIAGLYLTGSVRAAGYSSGYAALKEVREAIQAFKASGKPVKAYVDFATTRDLYVDSVASEIVLDPYGAILMPGLATQPMFFAGAFEKFGIGVQVTRVGKYKSAVEPYTRRDMSPENREQTQKLLDDVWATLTTSIEHDRKLAPGTVQKVADAKGLIRANDALKAGLVDRVAYLDEVLDELKAATGRRQSSEPFKQVALRDYAKLVSTGGLVAHRTDEKRVELGGGPGKLAIVYAEGEIVDGFGGEDGVLYGQKMARMLRELQQDRNVKAVVLRVNSPGGSVSASEAILREMRQLGRTKPVIVSMGTVAASGGYWISTCAERIFVEPSTITGSIGVFGMFLNIQGLANDKLGLTFDTVKTGKLAELLTITRAKTSDELAVFQDSVDWVYAQFLGKVGAARKIEPKALEEIAQGRVWSGAEAVKLGLADEIGGLAAAVKYAAKKGGLGENFRVAEYPRRKMFAEAFAEAFEGRRHDQSATAGPLGQFFDRATAELRTLAHFNDPSGLYARLPFELQFN